MADETPQLNNKPQKWYQGLSRTQWFVLIIATMGWMFDTMDQQFFNLGRGPAMMQVLDVDPVIYGLEKIKDRDSKKEYSVADIDALVAAGVMNAQQKERALTDHTGQPKDIATRKDVARAIGEDLLAPKYIKLCREGFIEKLDESKEELKELTQDFQTLKAKAASEETSEIKSKIEKLQASIEILKTLVGKDITAASFDSTQLNALVDGEVVSQTVVQKALDDSSTGMVAGNSLAKLHGKEVAKVKADEAGDDSTFIFVMGWAIGGLIFGWIGDSIGRAKTMAITILTYALFTGLNGLAQTELQFNILRFLTALGVGGEFAAGAALVAEYMPDRSRPAALGALQAFSAFGNMAGAALAFFIMPVLGWRWLFAVGALPGIVAVFVFLRLKEPQKWKEARQKWLEEKKAGVTKKLSSYGGLFQDPRWRRRAIVGLLLGVVGVGGLWGVGFFTPELNRSIAKAYSEEAKERFVAVAFFLQQLGAFFGISAYTYLSLRMGRKPAFGIFFVLAFFLVSYTFLFADTILDAYILAPVIGFVTLGPFGGYAIYFPELFPTRLRATGTGFCYNVGRFLAALVPKAKGGLKGLFMSGYLALPFLPSAVGDAELAIRYGSFIMIFIYIFGLFVLIFAPETKGKPLPED
ncbi:MAG: MFS transporter [Planctomycetota bacterium]|jgi:predicted MFS family arabinose efflux permease